LPEREYSSGSAPPRICCGPSGELEPREIGDLNYRLAVAICWSDAEKPLKIRRDVPWTLGERLEQGGDRDHQTGRLDIAEPFLMREDERGLSR
jgi:hypothetical protein